MDANVTELTNQMQTLMLQLESANQVIDNLSMENKNLKAQLEEYRNKNNMQLNKNLDKRPLIKDIIMSTGGIKRKRTTQEKNTENLNKKSIENINEYYGATYNNNKKKENY